MMLAMESFNLIYIVVIVIIIAIAAIITFVKSFGLEIKKIRTL